MSARRPPIRIRWWMFVYLFAWVTLSYVQRTSIGVAAEKIEPELHLSQMQIGFLMQSFVVLYTIMQVPGGVFGQRFGARLTYTLIGIVGILAMVGTPLAPMLLGGTALFLAMLFFQALLGASQGPVFPVFSGVCQTWFPVRQWGLAQGINSSAMNVGTALTPALVVVLEGGYGWQGALLWLSLPAAVLTALWWWYARDLPAEHSKVTAAELGELDPHYNGANPAVTWERLRRVASNRDVLLLALSYVCMNYLFYLLTNWSFLYLVQERHLSNLQSGTLAAVPPIAAAIGAAAGGVATDRFVARIGARRGYGVVPLVFLPLAGALLVAVAFAPSVLLAVTGLSLAFFATEVTEGPYWAATMRAAQADTMAATGVLNTGGNLGGVIGIPIVAFLSEHVGWNAAFVTGAVFAALAAGLWLLVDPTRHDHAPSGP